MNMATKKATTKKAQAASDTNTFKVVKSEDTHSQALAKLVTSSALSAVTAKQFAGGDTLDVSDLIVAMKKAGDEAVAGDMSRIERMLVNQLLTLDSIFNNMAQRSGRQDTFKGIEVLMRLALKAQAQARSTAEALALLKNPMPYIRQANIANGPQQVNNGYASASAHTGISTQPATHSSHAENFQSEPNKLLEADHGERLDTGAQTATGRAGQTVAAVG
jgi:uncharacterized membrane protein YheB (UPF0754 family)